MYTAGAVLSSLGRVGRYQLGQYALHGLSLATAVFVLLGYSLLSRSVPHQCAALSPQSFAGILASVGIDSIDVVSSTYVYNECTVNVTVTTLASTQSATVKCLDGFEYGDLKFTSIVSEFDLVCESEFLSRIPLIFLLAFMALGASLVPFIADKVGRKPVLISAMTASLLLSFVTASARSLGLFTAFQAANGVFIDAIILSSMTMAIELVQVTDRKWIGFAFILAWVFHILIMVSLAYVLRFESWRFLQYGIAAVALFVLVNILVLNESISWLYAVGREKEALRLIKFASNVNGLDPDKVILGKDLPNETPSASSADVRPSPTSTYTTGEYTDNASSPNDTALTSSVSGTDTSPIADNIGETSSTVTARTTSPNTSGLAGSDLSISAATSPEASLSSTTTPTASAVSISTDPTEAPAPPITTTTTAAAAELLYETCDEQSSGCGVYVKSKHLLRQTFILMFLWAVAAFSYYLLYYTEEALADGVFLNYTVNALPELVVAVVFVVAVDSIGRKKTLYIFLSIGVVFLLFSTLTRIFADNYVQKIMLPIFGFLSKLGVAGFYFTLLFYTGETFPTSFRLFGLGTAAFSGRLGALATPFVSLISVSIAWFPTAIISGLLFVSIFVVFALPETKGKQLPRCVEDVDALYS